jgi:uncharacterized protein (TIGR02598 family)
MSTRTLDNRRASAAFSLIEVVLALGVLAFSLVAILGVFPTGYAANRSSITDTRAAQIAQAIVATIDGQCSTFANVNCYGATLDLTALSAAAADAKTLYVSYPSTADPVISATRTADSIYIVELRFDNDPPLTSAPTKLGAGKLNRIQIRISGLSSAEGRVELFFMARNKG